jgi:chromosome segregation ATPase
MLLPKKCVNEFLILAPQEPVLLFQNTTYKGGEKMDKILEKAEEIQEKMSQVTNNIGFLERKKEKALSELLKCNEQISKVNQCIEQILAVGTKMDDSHILSKTLLLEKKALIGRRKKIEQKIKKYDYHLSIARRKYNEYQEKVTSSPEIYFYSRL